MLMYMTKWAGKKRQARRGAGPLVVSRVRAGPAVELFTWFYSQIRQEYVCWCMTKWASRARAGESLASLAIGPRSFPPPPPLVLHWCPRHRNNLPFPSLWEGRVRGDLPFSLYRCGILLSFGPRRKRGVWLAEKKSYQVSSSHNSPHTSAKKMMLKISSQFSF